MESSTHKFSADINRLFDIIVNNFYSQKEVFLSELVSNSSDAIEKIRLLLLQSENISEKDDLKINIKSNPDDQILEISDNGIGMDSDELINIIGKIANSGTKDFLVWCKKNKISMGVCTNKQERLAVDLLKKIGIANFFEYIAGSDTFAFCKPDSRHLTNVVEIMGGDIKKTIMIGDSEVDGKSAENASMPFVLLEDGYTDVKVSDIKYNHLIKDFVGLEKIIEKYL